MLVNKPGNMSPVSKSMLQKYLRGECSPEEEKHIRNWFDLNDASQFPPVMEEEEYLERERRIWGKLRKTLHFQELSRPVRRFPARRLLPYAAAVILLVTAYLVWNRVDPLSEGTRYETVSGEIRRVLLPDGTEVLLNVLSTMRIPADYGETDRKVYLEGEGYFKVRRDSSRAFTVYSGGIATTALGTTFNVAAYSNDGETIVSLHEGSVSVNSTEKSFRRLPRMVLEAGEEVVCQENGEYIRKPFNPRERLSWKDHILFFEEADLPEVILKLERYYGVRFHYEGLEGADWKLTGEYRRVPIEDILESLSFNYGIQYKIADREITLYK